MIHVRSLEISQMMRMKERRKELGLSQYDLERESGISRKTIIEIEQGKRNPTLGTLYALSKPLNMEVKIEFK